MPVSIAAAPGLLLISALSDRSLRAVDPGAHRILWTYTAKGPVAAPPQPAPIPAVGSGLVCVGDGRRLVCLEPATGAQRLAVALDGEALAPILAGGAAIVASRGGQIQAIELTQGKILWARQAEARIVSRLLLDHGRLFFADSTGQLVAME